MAFSHLSRTIRNVTGKTFARKFITLGKVINYWPEAVGPELAAKSYPVGMSVRKNTNKTSSKSSRDLVATLEIAASSADATLLHYQKSLILERLALLIGADMIVDIKVIHNGGPAISSAAPNSFTTKWVPRPLTNDVKTCLSQEAHGVEHVADDELRAVLDRLGQYIDHNSENPVTR